MRVVIAALGLGAVAVALRRPRALLVDLLTATTGTWVGVPTPPRAAVAESPGGGAER